MLPTYSTAVRRGLARNVLRNSLELRKGENLLIETWSGTLPWAEAVVHEARILGARPLLVVEDEPTYWETVAAAPPANVGAVGAHEWAAVKASDAYFEFAGPFDTLRDERRPAALRTRWESNEHEWFRLLHKHGIRSVRWDLGRTSEVWARRYGVDLGQWRRELIEGASTDPRPMRAVGRNVAQALARGHEVAVVHPNGTDLRLRLAGRPPQVHDGIMDAGRPRSGSPMTVLPSGVVGVAVDEKFAEGTFVANTTGVMFDHREEVPIRGRWEFREGKLHRSAMDLGRAAFARQLASHGVERITPGIISVGLNPKISTIPLLFDQERGTVAFELGRNSMFGGASRTPHLYAYLAVRGATLLVDGKTVLREGRLVRS